MPSYPFPAIWVGGDLGPFRHCDSTYGRYDLASLPRLPDDEFDGSYSWLRRHPSPLEYDERFARAWGDNGAVAWAAEAERARPELIGSAQAAGVNIPDEFLTFILDPTLVTMLRSPSDCYFRLSPHLVPGGGPAGGSFVHFLSDSQNCYEWYVFLAPGGGHCVVASDDDLADPTHPIGLWADERERIVCCAPSFEPFVYRLWIENESWFRLVIKDQPLTVEMRSYLDGSRGSRDT